MNPMPILLFLLTIPPLFLFSDCAPVPFSCGNLDDLSISYPFLVDKRPSYCGYDGFHLTCDYSSADPKLIIFIKSQSFQVLDVDYSNNFLTVVDLALAGQSCPQSYKNTSLDFSLFEYTELDRNLALYINCTGSPNSIPTFYEIACSLGAFGGRSYYRLDNSTAIDVFGVCSSTGVVPMNQTVADMLVNSRGGMNLSEAVRAGFTVRWLPGLGWCDDCIISGGFCGYSVSNPQEHTCFCSNGTADGTCSSLLEAASCWHSRTSEDQTIEAFLHKHGTLPPKRYSYLEVKRMTESFHQKLGEAQSAWRAPENAIVACKLSKGLFHSSSNQ
ncbi:hypothetical protein J5N97_028595 [Dioscorea zingiberensis]|uniref:Uncharacterized protein n=1 Tax=Dioscorea zingiberensis TaxID=325984 RepID=A0A9D5BZT6_9LILI|nr:hypothetical protein J5N97_028595 [Dioscorea zingiberensis]